MASSIKDKAALLDLYSSLELAYETAPESFGTGQVAGYEEYKPLSDLETGIKSGKYFQGTIFQAYNNGSSILGKLNVSKWRYHEAHVKTGEKASVKSIFIPDSAYRNRAIHGDVVAVEIVGKGKTSEDVEGLYSPPHVLIAY